MTNRVHFKLAYNGAIHRFAATLRDDALFDAVNKKVDSIVKEDVFELYWKDDDSNILLETADDLAAAIEFGMWNRKNDTKPPCVNIIIGDNEEQVAASASPAASATVARAAPAAAPTVADVDMAMQGLRFLKPIVGVNVEKKPIAADDAPAQTETFGGIRYEGCSRQVEMEKRRAAMLAPSREMPGRENMEHLRRLQAAADEVKEAAARQRWAEGEGATINPEVEIALEQAFAQTQYLTERKIDELAERLWLTDEQVMTWFANRREAWFIAQKVKADQSAEKEEDEIAKAYAEIEGIEARRQKLVRMEGDVKRAVPKSFAGIDELRAKCLADLTRLDELLVTLKKAQKSEEEKGRIDVFLSYRRWTDVDLASAICTLLRLRGLKVFMGNEAWASKSNARLVEQIKAAKHVIVVLTPNALDAVYKDNDMLSELRCAFEHNKNVIPIFDQHFEFPEKAYTIPNDIRQIAKIEGVWWLEDGQAACMDEVQRRMKEAEDRHAVQQPVKSINSDDALKEALEDAGSSPVLVRFSAQWCAPNKGIAPLYDQLRARYPSVVFLNVDVDKCYVTTAIHGVGTLPTFAMFVDKKKVDSVKGAYQDKLEAMVEKYAEAMDLSDVQVAEAEKKNEVRQLSDKEALEVSRLMDMGFEMPVCIKALAESANVDEAIEMLLNQERSVSPPVPSSFEFSPAEYGQSAPLKVVHPTIENSLHSIPQWELEALCSGGQLEKLSIAQKEATPPPAYMKEARPEPLSFAIPTARDLAAEKVGAAALEQLLRAADAKVAALAADSAAAAEKMKIIVTGADEPVLIDQTFALELDSIRDELMNEVSADLAAAADAVLFDAVPAAAPLAAPINHRSGLDLAAPTKQAVTRKKGVMTRINLSNLHFQQDPNDPKTWIFTNDLDTSSSPEEEVQSVTETRKPTISEGEQSWEEVEEEKNEEEEEECDDEESYEEYDECSEEDEEEEDEELEKIENGEEKEEDVSVVEEEKKENGCVWIGELKKEEAVVVGESKDEEDDELQITYISVPNKPIIPTVEEPVQQVKKEDSFTKRERELKIREKALQLKEEIFERRVAEFAVKMDEFEETMKKLNARVEKIEKSKKEEGMMKRMDKMEERLEKVEEKIDTVVL